MRCAEALVLFLFGCQDVPPPAPPPVPYIPIPPLETAPERTVTVEASAVARDPVVVAPPSVVAVELEAPYKLGRAPQAASREAYRADILDKRRWNDGGVGDPPPELPPPEGHPDPRIIIDVERVRGGHASKDIERIARKHHWMPMVRCYRLGAHKDPELRGTTRARIEVHKSGKVKSARFLDTELDDRAVARCMADKLRDLSFEPARSGATVWLRMRIGPGDDPLPPPDELLLPGDGALSIDAMRAGVEAGMAAFEACYRSALEYAPDLWGRIVIRFHVTERGKLDEAFEAGSRFPDKRMLQCVLRAARRLSFDRPKGGDIRFVAAVRFSKK
jgi:hypothetical protein